MAVLTIGGVGIGGDHPCRFVAELGANHNGSYDTAIRLIDAAKATGAEFCKMQAFTMDEIIGLRGDGPAPEPWASYGTLRQLYEKAVTPLEWLPGLFQHARDIGIVPFASVFGLESLKVLEDCGCPAYKIARLDNECEWLASAVTATGKPFLVSTSLPFPWPIQGGCWLWCPPGYPSSIDDAQLPVFECPCECCIQGEKMVGLSSHCLDPFLPIAAVARGAKLLEYHLQLDDEPAELDGLFSLTTHRFGQMVASVRQTERLLA